MTETKTIHSALVGGLILTELGLVLLWLTTTLVCFPLLPGTTGEIQTRTLLTTPWLLLMLGQVRFLQIPVPHADWRATSRLGVYWALGLLLAALAASFLPVRGLALLWFPVLFFFPLLLLADQLRALLVFSGMPEQVLKSRQLAVSALLVQLPTGIIWVLVCLVALLLGGREFLVTIPTWLRALLMLQLLVVITLGLRASAQTRRALARPAA